MKKEYDFSKGKRGAVLNAPGKSGITVYLDNDILDTIRDISDSSGQGYQTLINQVLREYLEKTSKPFRTKTLSELSGTDKEDRVKPYHPDSGGTHGKAQRL